MFINNVFLLFSQEAWVVIGGGSNSYGMGAATMKAVHNTDDATDGKDFTKFTKSASGVSMDST